jgi:hypothetical protein
LVTITKKEEWNSSAFLLKLICVGTPNNLTKGKSKLIIIYTDKISQQLENCENRNDPDLVQAFLKKWWVESDFKAPNINCKLDSLGARITMSSAYNRRLKLVPSMSILLFIDLI